MTTFALVLAAFAAGWAAATWRARRTEQQRARFLSFVAHEFITPVTTMNMTALNLLNGVFGDVPEETKTWIQMICEQISRLEALVGDLRDLVHLEFHRDLQLTPEPVRLAALAEKCLSSMREGIKRAGTQVEVEGLDALPELQADADRLQRVLAASLQHARKFRTKGPIRLVGRSSGGFVCLAVDYEGPAVPAETLRQALDLYHAVHNPKSQVLASTGLGLGIACRLVGLHGGRMTIEADSAGRTRIEIRLPERPL